MADPQQLINQANSGQLSYQDFIRNKYSGGAPPKITDPVAPAVQSTGGGFSDFYKNKYGAQAQQPTAPQQQGLPRVKTNLYNPQELAALKDEPSVMGDIIAPTAQTVGTSVYRGLVKGTTALIDLASYAAEKTVLLPSTLPENLGGPSKPKLNAAQQVREMMRVANEALPEQSKNIGARILEEATAAVPSSMLMGAGAIKAAQSAAATGSKVPWILQGMVDDLARLGNAGLAKLEGTMALVGATGGEAAVELNEALGIEAIPEWAARAVGNLGTVVGANTAVNAVKAARSKLSAKASTKPENVKLQVGRILEKQAPLDMPTFNSMARESEELSKAIRGFQLGTAEATQEAGYKKLSSSVLSADPETEQLAAAHVARNNEAHRGFLNHAKTRMDLGDDAVFVDKIKARLSELEDDVVTRTEQEVMQAQQNAQQQMLAQQQAAGTQYQTTEAAYQTQLTGLQQQLGQAQSEVTGLQGRAMGDVGGAASAVKDTIKTAEDHFRQLSNTMFTKAGQEVGKEPLFKLNTLKRTISGIMKESQGGFTSYTQIAGNSPTLRRLSENITAAGKGVTLVPYKYMRELYSDAGEEIAYIKRRISMGQADVLEKRTMGTLIKVQKAAQKELDRLDTGDLAAKYPNAAQSLRDAKGVFKTGAYEIRSEHFKRFTKLNTSGQHTIDDSIKAGEKLLQSADETGRYLRVMAGFGETGSNPLASFNNPAARDQLVQFAIESFVDKTVKNGVVDAGAMKTWITNHKGIRAIPELKQSLSSVAKAQELVDSLVGKGQKTGQIDQVTAQMDKDLTQISAGLQKQTNTIETDLLKQVDDIRKTSPKKLQTNDHKILENYTWNADPHVVIEEIMASRNKAQGFDTILKQINGDPDALRGLRRGIWDHMERHFYGDVDFTNPLSITNPKAIETYLNNYGPVLNKVFAPQEMHNLKIFQKAAERMSNEKDLFIKPSGNPKMEQEIKETYGFIHMVLNKVSGGVFGKGTDIPYTVAQARQNKIFNSFTSKQHAAMMKVMQDAIFDPEAARILRLGAKDISSKIFYNRFANYMQTHSMAINAIQSRMENARERQKINQQSAPTQ